MKWITKVSWITALVLGLFSGLMTYNNQAQAQGNAVEQKITVLSPMGIPPAIELKGMAPRLDTLDGKTVYLVNHGYLGTDILLREVEDWFEATMPVVNIVYRKKSGFFTSEDPSLWSEVKEKGDALIMAMGH